MTKETRQAIRTLSRDHDIVREGQALRAARHAYGHLFPLWMIDVASQSRGNNGATPALIALASSIAQANAVCICGPANAGKTYAALRWATKTGARWLPASELPARWDEHRAALVDAVQAKALVIDDIFGAGAHGPVAADCLRVILARRHDARSPTVMTSSQHAAEVSDRMGEHCAQRVRIVDVEAPDGPVTSTGSATRGDTYVGIVELLNACEVYVDDVDRHMTLAARLGLDTREIERVAAGVQETDPETLQLLRELC
jgi:hypothetical protein